MEQKIKSGQEIVDDFFDKITDLADVDEKIAKLLKELYSEGSLSEAKLKNELEKLRNEQKENDENS